MQKHRKNKKNHRRLPALRRDFCGFCLVGNYNSNMRHRRGADGRLGEYLKKREELLRMCGIVKRYLRKALVLTRAELVRSSALNIWQYLKKL